MLIKFLQKISAYISKKNKDYNLKKTWQNTLSQKLNIEQRFNSIYKNNLWGDPESVSGPGSSLAYTKNLRAKLPKLISDYKIKSVFDAPCGDLNWMKYLLPKLSIKYIGGDIIKDLIDQHKKFFENETIKFVHINLIEEKFPKVDLMICRDCLFHLSYKDIKGVLQNFIKAEIKYLLTTTFIEGRPHRDIISGDFRRLNLFQEPFSFNKNPLERIDDSIYPYPCRQICLWSRSQVADALASMKN